MAKIFNENVVILGSTKIALTEGMLKTDSTGLISLATAGTDYLLPTALTGYATESWVQSQLGAAGYGTVTSVGLTAPTGFIVSGSPVTTAGTLSFAFDAGYSLVSPTDRNTWNNKIDFSALNGYATESWVASQNYLTTETQTSIQAPLLNGNILTVYYTGENGVQQSQNVDLSSLAVPTNNITNATYDASTNIITLTKEDSTTQTIDLSEFSILSSTDVNGVTTLTQEDVVKATISKVGQTGQYSDLLNKPEETDPVFSASPAAGITSTQITNWDNPAITVQGTGGLISTGLGTTFPSEPSNSIILGIDAGKNFVGDVSGGNSNFLGYMSGYEANNAGYSNFFGYIAGHSATNATYSNFFGYMAGAAAANANNSNFIGNNAGNGATFASNSNFFGKNAGSSAENASYSNIFGYQAGMKISGNNIGANNIIIGTNISLPNSTANSMNLGGVLFGTGFYSSTAGDPSIIPSASGKIGILKVNPQEALDVEGAIQQSFTKSAIVKADANGKLVPAVAGTDYLTADSLPAPTVNKYVQLFGDGTATQYNITHNLNDEDVIVQVWDAVLKEVVDTEVKVIDANTIQITTVVAPTANQYKVVVLK